MTGRALAESEPLVAVNYSPHDGQCFVSLHYSDLAGKTVRFSDLMSSALYNRDGDELLIEKPFFEPATVGLSCI
ncbi:MAG: hypothetical protein MZV63_49765 [Marinilabiliales bacterium]|nr:hypothetical protein [Marinilabiliales bacterium]